MSRNTKRMTLILFDALVIIATHVSSYFFLYPLIEISNRTFIVHVVLVALAYIVFGLSIKMFDKINRFTSIRETIIHVLLVTLSFVIGTLTYTVIADGISFRYMLAAFILSVIIIPASRIAWRLWIDHQRKLKNNESTSLDPVRTLLIGAGDGGAMYIQGLRNRSDVEVVGFLDDHLDKQRTTIYGYPVIGRIANLEETVEEYGVEQITIAIPSLSNDEMQQILNEARKTHVKTNQMPYIEDILSGDYSVDEPKEIEVTDLLGRDEVELDMEVIQEQIAGKTVLVSGAGGSIGSEISRQVAGFNPEKIILLGHGEFSIYKIDR